MTCIALLLRVSAHVMMKVPMHSRPSVNRIALSAVYVCHADDEYENDPAATSDGQPWAMPLRVLTKVVKQAEQKLKQTPGTAPTGKRAAAASSGGADANNLPFPTALLQAVIDRLDSRSAAAAAAACKSLRAAYTASRCFEVSEALQAYVQVRGKVVLLV